MKIYFAASIRGGSEDKDIYSAIISHLKKYGEVLTEHIIDPDSSPLHGSGFDVQKIYSEDITWLESADIVVAEVTTPSLGVGYELAYAEKLGKPVLCLYRNSNKRSLSAMIAGNSFFEVRIYSNISDAKSIISAYISKI